MASDGAVVQNVEVKEDDNGNQFFRMHFSKPGLDTGLVPFISFVDIPINGTSDKTDIDLKGDGLELELPTGELSVEIQEALSSLQEQIDTLNGDFASFSAEVNSIETMIDESGVLDE